MYILDTCPEHTQTHNRFTALFPGLPGWAGARRKLLHFVVQGKISEADTPTTQLVVTPSRLISDPPPSSPIFTLDAFPDATLPLYPGLGQACWLAYSVLHALKYCVISIDLCKQWVWPILLPKYMAEGCNCKIESTWEWESHLEAVKMNFMQWLAVQNWLISRAQAHTVQWLGDWLTSWTDTHLTASFPVQPG